MIDTYFDKLKKLITIIEKEEKYNLKKAASKIADCIQKDGILHVFGCGHSHILGEELFYRAGGLAPINPILIEDLMLHKGAVKSSELEQSEHFADNFTSSLILEPKDIVIVVSTSGRNPVPIDVANYVKKQGAYVIAITSIIYTKKVQSRHKSGNFLTDVADLTIDNHIEVGDALMKHDSLGISFGSGSTVVGTAIINGIMVEAIKIMIDNNFDPPIFRSGNADGATEHNLKLINKYKGRLPLL